MRYIDKDDNGLLPRIRDRVQTWFGHEAAHPKTDRSEEEESAWRQYIL